jgi:hypothetical protein
VIAQEMAELLDRLGRAFGDGPQAAAAPVRRPGEQ